MPNFVSKKEGDRVPTRMTTLMTAPSLRARTISFPAEWSAVESEVRRILADPYTPRQTPLTRLYTCVYRISSNTAVDVPDILEFPATVSPIERQCHVLHALLQKLLADHLQRVQTEIRGSDMDLIKSYLKQWEEFCFAIRLITCIFNYAHSQWKKLFHNMQSPSETSGIASSLWVRLIVVPSRVSLTRCLLDAITQDRNGEAVDRLTLRVMLISLANLSTGAQFDKRPAVYQELFETPYLIATESHYTALADKLMRTVSLREYLQHIQDMLRDENRRTTYLHSSSYPALKRTLINTLIERRLQHLVRDAAQWLDSRDTDALSKLYFALQQSEVCLDPLKRLFEERIDYNGKIEVQKIAADAQREPAALIPVLLQVYHVYHDVLVHTFGDNKSMRAAFLAGMRKVVNTNAITEVEGGKQQPGRAAEALAKYYNQLLRPGSLVNKNISDMHQFEEVVQQLLWIFNLLDERDVFQAFYANLMGNRLVFNNYTDEREQLVLQRFKEVCGHEFTYKWQRMYNDATNQLGEQFENYLINARVEKPFEVVPMVLTSGSWPNTQNVFEDEVAPAIPPSLSTMCAHFEAFYKTVGQGKRLRWMPAYSHGVVRNTYALERPRQYDFTISQLQLTFLALFNTGLPDEPLVPFATFVAATHTRDVLLCSRQLVPLLRAKLIVAEPAGAPEAEQSFRLNTAFFNVNRKVTLLPAFNANVAATRESDESEQVQQKVKGDRKFAIQAAIVRLMKSRRTMEYKDLLSETHNMLKAQFSAQVAQIKENLEVLIEKEYVERSADDPNRFNYLA